MFNLSPEWKWGFTAEQTSDSLLFEKYSIPDVYTDQGLYEADSQRLISQLYAVRQDSGSYLSVAAIEVQGLRSTDMQGTFPVIAPLIEGRWEPSDPILGGRLRIDGSAVALNLLFHIPLLGAVFITAADVLLLLAMLRLGLVDSARSLGAFIGGHTTDAALQTVKKFLADHPKLPKDLREKVLQSSDELERTVRIRKRWQ